MTDVLHILLPLLVLATFVAYVVVMRWLHIRHCDVPDPETCSSGASHWWRGAYRYPPTLEPVQEECERCGAIRVVAYENGIDECSVLRYVSPRS